jgi:hypothetical protein
MLALEQAYRVTRSTWPDGPLLGRSCYLESYSVKILQVSTGVLLNSLCVLSNILRTIAAAV